MKISIIDMPLFYGCDNPGVEKGPKVLRENNLLDIFRKSHTVCDMGEVSVEHIDPTNKYAANDKMKYLDEVVKANIGLADKVFEALQNKSLPLVIGGDHSLALGSIAASSKYYGDNLGVVWVDAHGDINTSETSPSGNIHGMPLAGSMGIGSEYLTNIYNKNNKINPKNVFILAARDLDDGELKIIEEYNLNVWTISDIKAKGIDKTINEFLAAVKKQNLEAMHFSFDIDCLDPSYVPGTGTPVENGLTFSECKKLMESIISTEIIKTIDFVEFNPDLDQNHKTLETCIELLNIISNSLKNN
ncbi:arginase [Clostridium sp.]|uniref:arginase n=1 Tax=Clostridium sp. TaxID=1506 RepID=UPI003F3427F4